MQFTRRDLLRTGVASAAGVTSGLVVPGLILPAESAQVLLRAPKRFPGDPGPGRIYYGASKPAGIPRWERKMGARLSLHRMYFQPRNTDGMARRVKATIGQGRMPYVSTKVPNNDWREVAAGGHDDWLHTMARALGQLDKAVFLSLHHEPENDRNDFAGRRPQDFVAMNNRALEIFDRYAPKVSVFPTLQGWMHRKRGVNPADWYVSDAAIYGVDIYNGWSPDNGQGWQPFSVGLAAVREHSNGKPIAIGEHGCRTDPSNPGRAARWMRKAYKASIKHNVVALSYFNSDNGATDGTWELDRERGRAFTRKLKAPRTK